MKITSLFRILLCMAALMGACSDPKTDNPPSPPGDDTAHDHEMKSVQSWIDARLCEWYLWNGDVAAKTPDYTLAWDKFFTSMLSADKLDGKDTNGGGHSWFSYIERTPVGSRAPIGVGGGNELGFQFTVFSLYLDVNGTATFLYMPKVEYVVPDSPADMAGIKRGDMVSTADGQRFMSVQACYDKLRSAEHSGGLSGPVSIKTVRLEYNGKTTNAGTPVYDEVAYQEIPVAPAAVDDRPLLLYDVITEGSKKIGYVVYNHFTSGHTPFATAEYNDQVKAAFADMKSKGVTDLILDLRYNGGGDSKCMQLLASLIVGPDKQGSVFANIDHNSKKSMYDKSLKFLTPGQMVDDGSYGSAPGSNLGMSTVYFLTSDYTASASEGVINGLMGHDDIRVYMVGTKTYGKNVGMTQVLSSKDRAGGYDGYHYDMWPVTMWITNVKGFGDYADGLPVSGVMDFEYDSISDVYRNELGNYDTSGDEYETLLCASLYHIKTGTWPAASRAGRVAKGLERHGSSLETRPYNGLRFAAADVE